MRLLKLGLLGIALLTCQTVLAQAPRPQSEQYLAGLIEDGLYDSALEMLKSTSIDSDKEGSKVFLSMAKIYSALGNAARAKRALKEAEELDPDSNRLILELARVEMVSGNLDLARRALEKAKLAKSLDPEDRIEIALIESRIALTLGKESVARSVLSRIRGNERLIIETAKVLLEQGDLFGARTVVSGFLKDSPTSGRSLYMSARIAEAARDKSGALSFYKQSAVQFVKANDEPRVEAALDAVRRLSSPEVKRDRQPSQEEPRADKVVEAELPKAKEIEAPSVPKVFEPVVPVSPPTTPTIIAKAFPFPPNASLFTGSGLVIDGGKRVITNRHVVDNSSNFYVRNSLGDLSPARVERVSKTDDLAVLVLETPFSADRSFSPSQFGEARAGANIAVIGFPLTDVLGSLTPSITNGIVIKTTGMQDSPDSFQVSAKMNKGNSGGAVFDTTGRVIGIAVGKLDTVKILQGSGFLPEDVNFAIHSDRLKVVGVSVRPGPKPIKELSLEELYQRSIGSVVMVAGQRN